MKLSPPVPQPLRGVGTLAFELPGNSHVELSLFDVAGRLVQTLEKGVLTMAINQQPYLQSYFAVANLANQAKYSLSPANINTGTSIVTQDNIAVVKECIAAGRC